MQRLNLQATAAPWQNAASNSNRSVRAKAATMERSAPAERRPRKENVEGGFYVDHTCIDCDTCRWMAEKTFARVNDQTAVVMQPETDAERKQALQALLACPTYSIHCQDKKPGEMRAAVDSFPIPVEGSRHAYHCGYSSEASYGSTSYLLVREGGNVLVDSPRFDSKLLKRIQGLGGAKYMFLTHKDDVADHVKWASALGCDRIIHQVEVTERQGTTACEIKLKGEGPWEMPDGGEDVSLIFTPGHTRGHVALWYQPEKILFSGDHLMFRAGGEMSIARRVNWYSIPEQLKSVEKVGQLDPRIVLPGHARRGYFADAEDRAAQFAELMQREGA